MTSIVSYARLVIVPFPRFLCMCLCVWLQHYMSASAAGYMLDYVSNSKQAIAVKGFWLCCHVSLAPVTFDSRASTKGTKKKKKFTLNKSLCSKWCILFVITGFHCGSMGLLTVEFIPLSSSWSMTAWGLCLVMKALHLVLVVPWVSRLVGMDWHPARMRVFYEMVIPHPAIVSRY